MNFTEPDIRALSSGGASPVATPTATARLLFNVSHDAGASGAVRLNGKDQVLWRPGADLPGYPFSLVCLFKPAGEGVIGGMFRSDSAWNAFYLENIGGEAAIVTAADASFGKASGGPVAAGTWHLAVCVWESPSLRRISVDGRAFVSDTTPLSPPGPDQFALGGVYQAGGLGGHFGGAIAHAALYGRALGDGDVAALWDGGACVGYDDLDAPQLAGLVAWYGQDRPGIDRHAGKHLRSIGGWGMADGPSGIEGPDWRPWQDESINRVGEWAIPDGSPAATYDHFGPGIRHAADAAGFQKADSNPFPGMAWEVGIRGHTAIRAGMGPVELCRSEGGGATARLYLDSQGRPTYEGKAPGTGARVVATCPTPLYGRLRVMGGRATAAGTYRNGGVGPRRTLCRLYVEDLGNVGVGDVVRVAGCGAPFDGERLLTIAYDDPSGGPGYVEFVVEGDSGAGATASAGTVTPTGEYEDVRIIPYEWVHTLRRRVRPGCLRVRRDGDTVTFWESGDLLGTVTAPGLPPGPSSGVVATIGRPASGDVDGPSSLPTRMEAFDSPLGDADALALDIRLCARVSAEVDYAGMPCHVDIESFPGVRRRQSQLHDWVILFTDARDQLLDGPIDERTGDRYGVSYADYTACDLGHEDQGSETTYRVWVAAFGKRWSTTGELLPPSLIGMAPVAEPRRLPWPRATYVDADNGDDATGDGSPGSPWKTFAKARDHVTPGTVVRLKGAGFGYWDLSGVVGPTLFTTWGPGRTRVDHGGGGECIKIEHGRHIGIKRLDLHNGNSYAGSPLVCIVPITSIGLMVKDCVATSPDGGGGQFISGGLIPYTLAHDNVTSPGRPHGYGVFLHFATRHFSLRRHHELRGSGDGSHPFRFAGGDCIEMGGCTWSGTNTTGYASVSIRTSPRRFSVYDTDCGPFSLAVISLAEAPEDGSFYNPPPHRITVQRNRALSFYVKGPAGHRYTSNFGYLSGTDVDAESDATLPSYPIVFEGHSNVGGLPLIDTPILAAPTSGDRRNVAGPAVDPAVPIWLPSVASLPSPAGWAVLTADGLPQGGVGWKRPVWEINDEIVPGSPALVIARPFPPGTYECRLSAVDASGATIHGPDIAMARVAAPDLEPTPDPQPAPEPPPPPAPQPELQPAVGSPSRDPKAQEGRVRNPFDTGPKSISAAPLDGGKWHPIRNQPGAGSRSLAAPPRAGEPGPSLSPRPPRRGS